MEKTQFFISHASEDKKDFVKQLADMLIIMGCKVFYDEYTIKLGDSLTESINKGISDSENAIIVISKHFLEKGWTTAELRSLVNKFIDSKFKLFIIYHNIGHKEVSLKYPLLSDIKAISSSEGVLKVATDITNAAGLSPIPQFGFVNEASIEPEKFDKGVSVLIRIAFPTLNNNPSKVFFELGNPKFLHSRLRMSLLRNQRIVFEFTDAKHKTFSISSDTSHWLTNESKIIIGTLNVKAKTISLFFDDTKKDELEIKGVFFDNTAYQEAKMSLGSNLEVDMPSPFIISHFSMSPALDENEVSKLVPIIEKFNNALNR